MDLRPRHPGEAVAVGEEVHHLGVVEVEASLQTGVAGDYLPLVVAVGWLP